MSAGRRGSRSAAVKLRLDADTARCHYPCTASRQRCWVVLLACQGWVARRASRLALVAFELGLSPGFQSKKVRAQSVKVVANGGLVLTRRTLSSLQARSAETAFPARSSLAFESVLSPPRAGVYALV